MAAFATLSQQLGVVFGHPSVPEPALRGAAVDIRPVRRVVTGHDAHGHAVVVMDGLAASVLNRPSRPGVALTDLWATAGRPTTRTDHDPVDRPVVLPPPPGGTVFRVVQFDPEDRQALARADGTAAFADLGAAGNVVASQRHPYMHRTDTVDYAVVLQGSITMLLDDEDVELSVGDVVIQNGTNHAWANRGTTPCLIAFVLIDATGDPGRG
jgi:mannose-6-phosphate isomerase-like protein (cupin superfamily)